MKNNYNNYLNKIAFFLFLIGAYGNLDSFADEMPLLKTSTSASQGQYLRLQMQTEKTIDLLWLGKDIPCYQQPSKIWDCFAAVPANASTGPRNLDVWSGDQKIATQKIEILNTDFPTEPMALSPQTKELYNASGRNKEVQSIRAALRTETREKYWDQPFILPIQGPIESRFGEKRVVDGKPQAGYHRGVDLAAPQGTPVAAMNSGKVLLANHFSQEGNMVMIDHGQGLISAYLHLFELKVTPGQQVTQGQIIGLVGTTGISNTTHLHLGFYLHSAPIDPLFWLKNQGTQEQ